MLIISFVICPFLGSWDSNLILWDMNDGTMVQTFVGHKDGVYGCDISHDSQYVVSASSDFTLKLWHLETGNVVASNYFRVKSSLKVKSETNILYCHPPKFSTRFGIFYSFINF